ncbi:hypothetical protein [Acidovorax sp.]|uniref:hypothetical protein n=1 Tax=Acidovorax sp. TaxID=1872122 RepID=UPI003CFE283B
MTSTTAQAIERIWYAIAPNGSGEGPVVLRVGMPHQEPDGDWSVLVGLSTLDGPPRKIFGVDGWQAAALGMRFVASLACDLEERGWRFYWSKGGESASAEDLLGG